MIKLEIKYADGSLYWKEHFNSQADCDKWLAEEKTRPYWKPEFTSSSVDLNPQDPVADADRAAKQALKAQKYTDRVAQLKALDWSTVTSMAQVKPILKLLVDDFLKDQ